MVRVAGVSETMLDGWGAPVLLASVGADGGKAECFLLIFAWHGIPEETRRAIGVLGADTVMVDMRELYADWKFLSDRHSNRADFLLLVQGEEQVRNMLSGSCPARRWLRHREMDALKAKYHEERIERMERERRERAEEKRRKRERAKAERLAEMEDFCLCNGLVLLEKRGAGELVDCPYDGVPVRARQAGVGCWYCEGMVRDFGTHIACCAAGCDD